ncbi:MAG: hypothetical protein LUQ38_05725 [Methanotrichaceae archaeon]|nr:hypothetical protein [Methanotrichaceae archaeon]
MPVATAKGYGNLASIDPDNPESHSFGNWLKLSQQDIRKAGYKSNADENVINVYVSSK